MAFDITNFLNTYGPAIASAVGTQAKSSDDRASTDKFVDTLQSAADTMKTGYDEQLGFRQDLADYLRSISGAQLTDTGDILDTTSDTYSADQQGAVNQFANYLQPAFEDYASGTEAALQQYLDALTGSTAAATDTLMQGSQEYEDQYEPYTASGESANQYLTQVMSQDPTQLTRTQRTQLEDTRRNALNVLGSSGLRGSGRAGVYSAARAINDAEAAMVDQNQRRADNAASGLVSRGFSATGNVASNKANLGTNVANMQTRLGETAGQALANTGKDIAAKGFNTADTIARTRLGANQNVNQTTFNVGSQKASNLSDFYSNLANIEKDRLSAMGDTALARSAQDASVKEAAARQGLSTDNQATKDKYQTLTQIGKYLTDLNKASQTKKPDSNTMNGQVMSTQQT